MNITTVGGKIEVIFSSTVKDVFVANKIIGYKVYGETIKLYTPKGLHSHLDIDYADIVNVDGSAKTSFANLLTAIDLAILPEVTP